MRASWGFVHFEVKDQGIGMDQKTLDLLFDREMSSRPGTNNERGVGLGLYLCKSCVDSHGGYIEAQSSPGEGSCFKVGFPLSTSALQ